MEFVKGYFTIERNIRGLPTEQIERRLGFRRGRLTHGCRILALLREPLPEEFQSMGSTLFPQGKGLIGIPNFRPGAWLRERLVKVDATLPHTYSEWYPPSLSIAAEQWVLTKPVPARVVCHLNVGDTYRRR